MTNDEGRATNDTSADSRCSVLSLFSTGCKYRRVGTSEARACQNSPVALDLRQGALPLTWQREGECEGEKVTTSFPFFPLSFFCNFSFLFLLFSLISLPASISDIPKEILPGIVIYCHPRRRSMLPGRRTIDGNMARPLGGKLTKIERLITCQTFATRKYCPPAVALSTSNWCPLQLPEPGSALSPTPNPPLPSPHPQFFPIL